MQRRAPVPILGVNVSARIEESADDAVGGGMSGKVQRGRAVRCWRAQQPTLLVNGEQLLDSRAIAAVSREMQRCRPVVRGAHVEVGVGLGQRRDHGGVPARRGHHEGSRAIVVCRIEVDAAGRTCRQRPPAERGYALEMAVAGCPHERRPPARALLCWVEARVTQELENRSVPPLGSDADGGEALGIARVQRGACTQSAPDAK